MFDFNHDLLFKLLPGLLELLNGINPYVKQILPHVLNHIEVFFRQQLALIFPHFSFLPIFAIARQHKCLRLHIMFHWILCIDISELRYILPASCPSFLQLALVSLCKATYLLTLNHRHHLGMDHWCDISGTCHQFEPLFNVLLLVF